MTISEYLKYAELAQAAYANLTIGTFSDVDLESLRDAADMTTTQSQVFADNWNVIDQYDGMVEETYYDEFGDEQTFLNPTGLSVTLFEDSAGNQTDAVRGTQDASDWVTNFIDIGLLGSAEYQAQYKALSDKIELWKADGILRSGYTVTGHSLGGFLATNLALHFPEDVAHTYLYNSPGLFGVVAGDLWASVANALSPGTPFTIPALSSISNIVSIWDPASEIGLSVAPPITIQIESNANPIHNHSIVTLTDTLAVYNLFSQVDPSLSVDEATAILKTSAYTADHTLESAVTALGELFVTGFTSRTGSEYDTERDHLYIDIESINNVLGDTSGLSIEALSTTDTEGNVTPFSPYDIESNARTDIAYRYALVNLNPFAVVGADYSSFNQNGELDIFYPATGKGQLSTMYLVDRAEMLSFLIEKNINDGANQSIIRFEDKASGEVVLQQGLNAPQRSVVFGSEQGEELDGSKPSAEQPYIGDNFNDRLYCMGGNDTLLCGVLSVELTMSEAA